MKGERMMADKNIFYAAGMNLRIGSDNKSMGIFPGKYDPSIQGVIERLLSNPSKRPREIITASFRKREIRLLRNASKRNRRKLKVFLH
jgi:hypothetical protein